MGWFQGNVKIIACEDERSVKLYKAAVAQVGEVYAGAKLVAVDWSEVPSRPRARIWVPATFKEPERILKMLQRCNPGLPTSDWKVAKVETTQGPTNQAVLVLNKESLAPIEAAKGELNFGFSSVTIKVYKSDAAAAALPVVNPDVQDVAAEIEAPDDELEPDQEGFSSETELMLDFESMCRERVSDDSDADITVVENLEDGPKDPSNKSPPL
ncbi:uncharacterized protein LOC117186551 isoform X1 [Drosophila miranda]|uniref:uncharacterized protein LOC117186551 isoform X1 n=2 Tax=Drosophila miranda TaxID=7229 RepID=UPI00143F5CE1|nr:uncharacterized protein LOC117186551 isoform X1 [Drosophila miranda]XP_033243370.1 uncharacterized protein LOC117186551 isoform X2 [Drosophila miranda]XP_033243371.1 uncharacterized protein LOC117186551 isoform X1 [Drosophila miranda]